MKASHNKIPFRVCILDHNQLHNLIQKWIKAHDTQILIHRLYFKYFPHAVTQIDKQFLIKLISYTIQKRFPSLFRQKSQVFLLQQSDYLKKQYTIMNINRMMKNDNYFSFFCVYFTKLVAVFMQDTFMEIDVCKQLEAEMYVIIVHVILGLEVSTKSYQVNHKKVINQKQTKFGKQISVFKMDSIESITSKPSSKRLFGGKEKKKIFIARKGTAFEYDKEEPNVLDQFKEVLHKNLAVETLPKLIKKKIKAHQFDDYAIKMQLQKQNDEIRYLFEREVQEEIKSVKQYLNSNQNSTSFQLLFQKNNQKTSFVHRNVKISHRPQLFINRKHKTHLSMGQTVGQLTHNIQSNNTEQIKNKNWQKIIAKIKHNKLLINKFNHIHQEDDANVHTENNQFVNSNKTIASISKQNLTQFLLQQNQQNQFSLTKKEGNIGSYLIEDQTSNIEIKPAKCNMLKSQKARIERHRFDISCQTRNHEANDSIFNITSSSIHFSAK